MSKSILVIDTPEACIGCPCCFADNVMIWCGKQQKALCEPMTLTEGIEKFNPDWCPLRDFPEKKPKVEYHGNGCFGINEAMKSSFNMGFNSCIDEILKGDGQG